MAVPVYPPSPLNLKGDMFKLDHIANNSGSKAALTTGLYKNVVRISKLRGVKWPVKDWYPTDGVEVRARRWSCAGFQGVALLLLTADENLWWRHVKLFVLVQELL